MIAVKMVVVSIVALHFIVISPQKLAADERPDGWPVIEAAREYSADYKGVAVVIFMGKDVEYTADQLGRGFVKAFGNLNTEARYFADDLGWDVTSISFYLDKGDAIGPFNLTNALREVPTIAEKHRIANLHPYQ